MNNPTLNFNPVRVVDVLPRYAADYTRAMRSSSIRTGILTTECVCSREKSDIKGAIPVFRDGESKL
jgi:hypothetical protein